MENKAKKALLYSVSGTVYQCPLPENYTGNELFSVLDLLRDQVVLAENLRDLGKPRYVVMANVSAIQVVSEDD